MPDRRFLLLAAFLVPVYLLAQPLAREFAMEAMAPNNGDFEYRNYANKTLYFSSAPQAVPMEVEFFRTRIQTYEAKGETPSRGQIRGYDASGNLRFDASYLRDKLTGYCKSLHPNGQIRDSGRLLMNLPDGAWHFFDADGNLTSVRHYDAFMWWSLQWSVELQNPFWNRFELSEWYARNKRNFYRSVVAMETFEDKYSPLFEYCLHHGAYTNFYPNGQVADSGNYYKGVQDGVWKHYYDDGTLKSKGGYLLGVKHGTWVMHHADGRLQKLEVYRRGRLAESKSYDN